MTLCEFQKTELLYLKDSHLFKFSEARILSVSDSSEGPVFIFDRTIFYPQGGGQPSDRGFCTVNGHEFEVTSVSMAKEDGLVKHVCSPIPDVDFSTFIGEIAVQNVDVPLRLLNTRLHSAGHLIDAAVIKLGLGWTPVKGYHFSDGPYVEYTVGDFVLTDSKKPEILKNFENECNNFIKQNLELRSWIEGSVVDVTCKRFVDVAGAVGMCGGTHVKMLSEVGEIKIKGISKKKKNLRVTYSITSEDSHSVTVRA